MFIEVTLVAGSETPFPRSIQGSLVDNRTRLYTGLPTYRHLLESYLDQIKANQHLDSSVWPSLSRWSPAGLW